MVRPFRGCLWHRGRGPDGSPPARFSVQPVSDSTQITSTGFFDQLDTSSVFALRDYSCPARSQGLMAHAWVPGNPYAAGTQALGNVGAQRNAPIAPRMSLTHAWGAPRTWGSCPPTRIRDAGCPGGAEGLSAKGHNLAGWYVYRAMVRHQSVGERLCRNGAVGVFARRSITVGEWVWTLNPHFDIRLSGEIAIPGEGYKDLARLADCDPNAAGVQSCAGNDPALKGEARFRARF